jgi:hypothetical protein
VGAFEVLAFSLYTHHDFPVRKVFFDDCPWPRTCFDIIPELLENDCLSQFLLATVAFLHPPSRAYIDPWTGDFFGEGGVEQDLRLPLHDGVRPLLAQGGVIMSKLGNETAKWVMRGAVPLRLTRLLQGGARSRDVEVVVCLRFIINDAR